MDKILQKVEKTSTCWNWLGEITNQGYGRLQFKNKRIKAHRFFYMLFKGKIPIGLELDHLCQNKKCVNPKHLEAVTHRENIIRAWKIRIKNTPNCPKGHNYSKKNLYIIKDKTGKTWRGCRKCRALNARIFRKNNPEKIQKIQKKI